MKNKLPAIFFYGLCSAAVLTGCASSRSTENKTVPQTEQQKPQQCISFQQSLKSQLNTWQKEKRNNDFQIQRLKEMLTDSALTKEDKFFIRERITVLCSVPEDNSGPWIWTRSPLESFDRGV